MTLTLDVSTPPGGRPPSHERCVFHETGGTIGRSADNDLVLPDSYVSLRHAQIRYGNGAFQIEDCKSTNGISVNSTENRVVQGQPYTLKPGDCIFIDPYEIRVSFVAEPVRPLQPPNAEDPFGLVDVPAPSPMPRAYSPVIPEPSGGADVDPLSLLGFDPDRAQTPAPPRAADLARGSVISEHYRAPDRVKPPPPEPSSPTESTEGTGVLIPKDYDPLVGSDVKKRPAPPPPAPERTLEIRPQPGSPPAAPLPSRSDSTIDLAEVLAGAGVTGVTVTPDLARDFGRVLHVVVSGLMEVLRSRQQIKDEFRMRVTTVKPTQNNPLKFSANVEDALHNLLVKRNQAYLGTVDAFEDAFEDVRNHQMAMLAGLRVAYDAMLKSFDPDVLQQDFDRHGKSSLISLPKHRYWEQYRSRFNDMVSDADACFRELFGHEFAKAYEEQLERLKTQGHSRRSRS